ncbi:MAG TPA: hypothetical protein VG013_23635, partial [Gemmataceae bacterium]|nr:hypothetical protein [Gemmataceae bacterium]
MFGIEVEPRTPERLFDIDFHVASTYGVHVRYDALAERVGFAAAHHKAAEYSALLKKQLGRAEGYDVGRTEDAARDASPGRKLDLESTFLAFRVTADDGRFHDEDMQK